MVEYGHLPLLTAELLALAIGLMSRVFSNGLGNLGSIQHRVISKTQKMILDAASLNSQHYNVRIKSKVEPSREWSSTLLHLGVVAIEKGAFGSPLTKVANFTYLLALAYCHSSLLDYLLLLVTDSLLTKHPIWL